MHILGPSITIKRAYRTLVNSERTGWFELNMMKTLRYKKSFCRHVVLNFHFGGLRTQKMYETFFTFMWPCIVTNFFLIKPTDALIFPNLFLSKNSTRFEQSSSAHHQDFFTVHLALVYIMQVWWQLSSTFILNVFESCHQTCMTHTSAQCTVKNSWWWAEELPETCRISWQK